MPKIEELELDVIYELDKRLVDMRNDLDYLYYIFFEEENVEADVFKTDVVSFKIEVNDMIKHLAHERECGNFVKCEACKGEGGYYDRYDWFACEKCGGQGKLRPNGTSS